MNAAQGKPHKYHTIYSWYLHLMLHSYRTLDYLVTIQRRKLENSPHQYGTRPVRVKQVMYLTDQEAVPVGRSPVL